MVASPLMLFGFAVFGVGFFLFAYPLMTNGGVATARQFRVLGELIRGEHGRKARLSLMVSFVVMPIGACFCFGGVAKGDHERFRRCTAYCQSNGYNASRIGPNSDRSEDRRTWFVACICEEGDLGKTPMEVRADALVWPEGQAAPSVSE